MGSRRLSPAHLAIALSVVVIWGFNVVAIKVAVAAIPPLFACLLRFVIVAICLSPWLRWKPGQMLKLAALSVTFGVLNFGLLFVSMQHIDGTLVAIIVQTSVPMSLLLARLFLGERFGWVRGVGVALAFVGVVVLFGEPSAHSHPWAVGLLLASLLSWSIGNIQLKGLDDVSPFTMQAWVCLLAAPMLGALSFVFEADQLTAAAQADAIAWSGVIYSALAGSAVAHSLWYWLLSRYEVGAVVPLLLLQPIVATGAAIWLLDERLGAYGWAGGAVVLVGVSIVQLRARGRRSQPAQALRPHSA